MIRRRTILDTLTRARLLELARTFDLSGLTGQPKDVIAASIGGTRSIKTPDLLAELSRDELKEVCRAAGIDDLGREKAVLVERLLGQSSAAVQPAAASVGRRPEDSVDEEPFGLQSGPSPRRGRGGRSATTAKSQSKSGSSSVSRKRPIEQYEHSNEQRLNNPPVGLVTPATDPDQGQKRRRYEYDPHLDPQLVWAGKAEHTSFEVPTVSLHVHERIDALSIIEAVRKRNGDQLAGRLVQQSLFDAPTENPPLRQAVDFYRHAHGWSNRMIAGDSLLVMNSLLEKEGLAGKVQMIYIDPPYGIRYGSNFQPFVNRRDVKDGKDEDLTQEPEMIRAFRDTWELGIHSYLTYLRDRLLLARELLHESGSCFVQISDENLHRVRDLMDDVFGVNNFIALISFKKTGGQSSTSIAGICDYLIWYARDKGRQKQHKLYFEKSPGLEGAKQYNWVELPSGERRPLSRAESAENAPNGARIFQPYPLVSMGHSASDRIFAWSGKEFRPSPNRHWSVTADGLGKLAQSNRLLAIGDTLRFVNFLEDYPVTPITNMWTDTQTSGFATDRYYVVQTLSLVIARCLLMTTDPGDLVLDPTCGSGTTAFVAEQWGRRWITCDTSRVALTLTKQRLMTGVFDFYDLARPEEGVAGGFRYKTVPHVTLKSIANNPDIRDGMTRAEIEAAITRHAKPETLYDQPLVDKSKVRVSGPFTVEAVPAPAVLGVGSGQGSVDSDAQASSADHWPQTTDHSVSRSGETLRQSEWRDELAKCGIRGRAGQRIEFARLEPLGGTRWLQCLGETRVQANGRVERVVVSYGPEHGPLEQRQVEQALNEATALKPAPTMVVFAAFHFDPEAAKDIDETNWPGVTLLKVQMNTDLLTDDLKKKRASNESYWLIGQPDVELRRIDSGEHRGKWEVEVRGFDYYNPKTGALESGDSSKIAMWLLDTDYDGRALDAKQVFFPLAGEKDGWARLAKNLKAEIDEELIETYRGTVSLPFEAGEHGRVAVKIVDDRGIESLRILAL